LHFDNYISIVLDYIPCQSLSQCKARTNSWTELALRSPRGTGRSCTTTCRGPLNTTAFIVVGRFMFGDSGRVPLKHKQSENSRFETLCASDRCFCNWQAMRGFGRLRRCPSPRSRSGVLLSSSNSTGEGLISYFFMVNDILPRFWVNCINLLNLLQAW
jgi:hypothetical protein